MKSQFEVVDDSVHCGIIVDESDDENLRNGGNVILST